MGGSTKKQAQRTSLPQRWLTKFNNFQQRHGFLGIPIAVVKKYHDDEGGHQAALITYYGFLSLFPLLFVATVSIQLLVHNNPDLQDRLLSSMMGYFPTLGDTLTSSLQNSSKTGLALFVGVLIAFYGAKGVADAVQHALHIVWSVPRRKRAGFPVATLRSLLMVIFAGLGLVMSAALTGYATSSTLAYPIKIALGTIGFITLFAVFWGVSTFGSSARKRPIANVPGALIAAVGLLFLQSVGGLLVAYQLQRQTTLNTQFGIVIVLLFWIYLQARVFLYALEYNTVRAHHLYPRSLDDSQLTEADKKAHALYAARDNYTPEEL